jgi:hypothetical protein
MSLQYAPGAASAPTFRVNATWPGLAGYAAKLTHGAGTCRRLACRPAASGTTESASGPLPDTETDSG